MAYELIGMQTDRKNMKAITKTGCQMVFGLIGIGMGRKSWKDIAKMEKKKDW